MPLPVFAQELEVRRCTRCRRGLFRAALSLITPTLHTSPSHSVWRGLSWRTPPAFPTSPTVRDDANTSGGRRTVPRRWVMRSKRCSPRRSPAERGDGSPQVVHKIAPALPRHDDEGGGRAVRGLLAAASGDPGVSAGTPRVASPRSRLRRERPARSHEVPCAPCDTHGHQTHQREHGARWMSSTSASR